MSDDDAVEAAVRRFEDAFARSYLTFHRRDGRRSQLSGTSRAVLNHLALTGPLTIGEAAVHLDRAQSVVSDIVTQLEGNGLLERMADPRDRRRTLVWLTDLGQQRLARDRRALDPDLLRTAMSQLTPDARTTLLELLDDLVAAAPVLKENPDD